MYQSKWRLVQNSRGYTLLEALFSLSVFVLLSQIVMVVMIWIQQMNTSFFTNEQVSWELFAQDIQSSFWNVKDIKLSSDSKTIELSYTNTTEIRKLNRSGDVLRQLVDNQGNIPLLIGIKSVEFEWEGQFLTISAEFQNGLEKERRFFVQTNNK